MCHYGSLRNNGHYLILFLKLVAAFDHFIEYSNKGEEDALSLSLNTYKRIVKLTEQN